MDESEFKLGQKVKFVRVKEVPGQPNEMVESDGMIVGKFLDPINRLKLHVRDANATNKQAYSVEPYCINPSEAQKIEFYTHHQRINDLSNALNVDVVRVQQEMVASGNKQVDELNEAFFGPPVLPDETVH